MSSHDSSPALLVTGAGRNVGAALVDAFLADDRPVIGQYRTHTDAVDRLAERGARMLAGDFSSEAGIFDFIERLEAPDPALCGIIHNASAFTPTAAEPHDAARQFQDFFAVHMLAPYLITRRLRHRLHGPSGAPADIIHITDIYSDNPSPVHDIYCATKAGLQNLALSFARSLAPAVKVNVIQPGPIHFPTGYSEADSQAVLKTTPLGRPGGAAAIVQAVRSILANDFMTGAVIAVDGGRRLGQGGAE